MMRWIVQVSYKSRVLSMFAVDAEEEREAIAKGEEIARRTYKGKINIRVWMD